MLAAKLGVIQVQHLVVLLQLEVKERQVPPQMKAEVAARVPMGLEAAQPGDAMANSGSAVSVVFSRAPVSVPKWVYSPMVASKQSTASWLAAV